MSDQEKSALAYLVKLGIKCNLSKVVIIEKAERLGFKGRTASKYYKIFKGGSHE